MTNLGYACLLEGDKNAKFRTLRKVNLSDANLIEIIKHNLKVFDYILDYNIKNDIKLYRLTSDLIPFGSSDLNTFDWKNYFKDEFNQLSKKIKENHIRITMHPGQYTVLNSPNENVVNQSIMDLTYHQDLLEVLNLDDKSKMVLHIGGVYGDKEEAIRRFINNFKKLDDKIKKRLIIENDEKSYNIQDVLTISKEINVPVVFDNLHHHINPPSINKTDDEWIIEVSKTWKEKDGRQKIHYANQHPLKNIGAHSDSIDKDLFIPYFQKLTNKDIDIMFEVKDKNLSVIKIKKILENKMD